METRKFIWNFFLVLIFGAFSIVAVTRLDGFWSYVTWLFLCVLTGTAANRIEQTFKKVK